MHMAKGFQIVRMANAIVVSPDRFSVTSVCWAKCEGGGKISTHLGGN